MAGVLNAILSLWCLANGINSTAIVDGRTWTRAALIIYIVFSKDFIDCMISPVYIQLTFY